MSETARMAMQQLANQYARQGFRNHRTAKITNGEGVPELEAHGLIKAVGTGRHEFRFTDRGQRWMMEHYDLSEGGAPPAPRQAEPLVVVPERLPRPVYAGPVPDLGNFPKRTLLLGAGFTKNVGGFLANEIWTQLFGRQDLRDRSALRRAFAQALGKFETALHLARTDAAVPAADSEALEAAIVEVFRSQERTISRQLAKLNTLKLEEFLSFFGRGPRNMGNMFAGIDSGYIFGTNQDWCIERFSVNDHMFDVPVTPGIPRHTMRFAETNKAFDESDIRLVPDVGSEGFPPTFKGSLNYGKLHGGFDLRTRDNRRALVMGAEKSAQIENFGLLTLYWQVFEQVLSTDGMRLMTIGYGFGDAHINAAIARAVLAHGLRLFMIDVRDVIETRKALLALGDDGATIFEAITLGYSQAPLTETFAPSSGAHRTEEYRRILKVFFDWDLP